MSVDLSGGAGGQQNINMSASAPGGTLHNDDVNGNNDVKHFVMNPMLDAAAETARASLERGVSEIRNFIEQNPSSVRATIFTMAFLEAIYCVLGVFNVFTAAFTPIRTTPSAPTMNSATTRPPSLS